MVGGQALPHEHDETSNNAANGTASDLKGMAQRAGRAVRDAMPGTDSSVESGPWPARDSAEAAREAEDRAVAAATREAEEHVERVRRDAEVDAERVRAAEEEAGVLAQEAADRAKEDAERIRAQVREDQKQAHAAVSQADGLRERTAKEAADVTRTIRRTERPVLAEMTRADLRHLAAEREISGRSSMSKKQLAAALEKKQ